MMIRPLARAIVKSASIILKCSLNATAYDKAYPQIQPLRLMHPANPRYNE